MVKPVTTLCLTTVNSPIGDILLVTDNNALVSLDYQGYEHRMMRLLTKRYGAFELIENCRDGQNCSPLEATLRGHIHAYLEGDLTAIDHIPVNPGGTKFQSTVWHALRTIPVGTAISYGELARQLGNPAAVRAVGTTNGLNPISIVLPCHRVIGANGSLTGYAGGLERKHWLLHHEGVDLATFKQKSSPGQQLSLLDN
ncbi:methylated-dna--protein-cysteine methyltransferase [Leptolyngbya sp. Heron Island J]|uniref:methylated-DNA--[protein]-cysteine S-methyltransferase n=1 Tax=Leptolyngbya sp. Heron Island J TaxID=1385935 RepID=UPI0003B9A590|nr:methylated-DNA--[protein]-cysteine S-methyltransferase [Leptolyngbya sp. Heron Island J]ESA32073.1 methylated-dna--protein-cysteine methyltransferase [Leptolyngbya sp. Heron Island J]